MNGHQKRRNTGGIPPRWLRCPRKSEGFVAEKFLVFKTPLSEKYDDALPPEFRFYPKMIMDYMKMNNVRHNK
jgi:mRNA-capping enzyme